MIFAGRKAFFLREGGENRQHEFSIGTQRVDILSLKPHINVKLLQSSDHIERGNPVLTEYAEVTVDDSGIADISVSGTGEDSTVLVRVHAYGDTSFAIKDGDNEYQYNIRIYEDDLGTSQIDITSK